jgi:hypothetical protein
MRLCILKLSTLELSTTDDTEDTEVQSSTTTGFSLLSSVSSVVESVAASS